MTEDAYVESDLDSLIDKMPWALRNRILSHLADEEIKERVSKEGPKPKRSIWKKTGRVMLYVLAVLWALLWMPITFLLFISIVGIPAGIVSLLIAGWPLSALLGQQIWLYHTGEKSFKAYKRKHLSNKVSSKEN